MVWIFDASLEPNQAHAFIGVVLSCPFQTIFKNVLVKWQEFLPPQMQYFILVTFAKYDKKNILSCLFKFRQEKKSCYLS